MPLIWLLIGMKKVALLRNKKKSITPAQIKKLLADDRARMKKAPVGAARKTRAKRVVKKTPAAAGRKKNPISHLKIKVLIEPKAKNGTWMHVASFLDEKEAGIYARDLARRHPAANVGVDDGK
jgi:hypothetical protein